MPQETKVDIILDDDLENRPTPKGFKRFVTGNDLRLFMLMNPMIKIGYITFDNDLGDGLPQGYDLVKQMVFDEWHVTNINVHSANTVANRAMIQTINGAIRHGMFHADSVTSIPLKSFIELIQK